MAANDAVVIGAGHNGLVAANMLADRGWSVLVLEAADRPGGAVRSDTSLHPDYVTDWYSAFHPLAAASPVLQGLELDRWGLHWSHAPAVLAHLLPDDRCAVIYRDRGRTAASLDAFAEGDGAAWTALTEQYESIRPHLLDALFRPFPPVRSALGLARTLKTAGLLRFARFAVQSVRRMGEEHFSGQGGPLLLAGNALHTDLGPESPGSAIYGWLLSMLAQTEGYPVPRGGTSMLTDALVRRLEASGGTVRTSSPVTRIDVMDGRARGVVLESGERIAAGAVLADVGAPQLYLDLVGAHHLPDRFVDDLGAFQWDAPTLKVNWALSSPIPWTAEPVRGAGTVHLDVDLDGLTRYAAALATRELPREPFMLLGQMTTSDASRSPAGTESAWAYTHVPHGIEMTEDAVAEHVGRLEAVVERHAPGFSSAIVARRVQTPGDLQSADSNLMHGAVGGGTSNLYQQLVFRPVPGLARADTPVDGLFLASASAHPGGGVHGGPGSNAARAAMRRAGATGRAYRSVIDLANRRIYR